MCCKINATFYIICNFLSNLYPFSFKWTEVYFSQNSILILELNSTYSSCQGHIRIASDSIIFNLMKMGKCICCFELCIKKDLPCKSQCFTCISLHPLRWTMLDWSFTSLPRIISSASIPVDKFTINMKVIMEYISL